MIYGVIMAGGSGTRLWPESRQNRPKQLFKLNGEKSILAATVSRIMPVIPVSNILISTGSGMIPMIKEELDRFPKANFISEPCSRNTAPAIGLAALEVFARNPEGIMVVLPADHLIEPPELFDDVIRAAIELINEEPNRIITIGIEPTCPATGFGYIRTAAALDSPAALSFHKTAIPFEVAAFHEKPDKATAERYLAEGGYLWNAGIFVWKAKRVLELLDQLQPEIGQRLATIRKSLYHDDANAVLAEEYEQMPSVSIDIAIMEKADRIITLSAQMKWNDIGSFESLSSIAADGRDNDGNIASGIELATVGAKNNIVRWEIGRPGERPNELLAVIGVDNLEIVRQGNAILIARRGSEPLIRQLVEKLRVEGRDEFL